ncbi:hypothetical protein CkaCkLH20_10904 [Colletotrichum karsti]|uniref:Uncharacterized protein n=1 Tax=Colletotrichum karsti TaxID=1095194 RepID=A0A9P6HYY8_9PEZI|nr:uncharacterized protein CkaCkLH20_10904 [Colletotrichum karsti]KAF9871706.1 hypothetical protein CkaCkLH20_10904 [Colletotrichum karsti]
MKTSTRRNGPQAISSAPAPPTASDILIEMFRLETERMMQEIMGVSFYQNMGYRPLTRPRAVGPQGRRNRSIF